MTVQEALLSKSFVTYLTRWFDKNARDLPWRRTRDPYAIWISEVMLQQTQIQTVLPYYDRFLREFPDVRMLAKAPLDRILKVWEGLGYYARARNLHRAAREIRKNSRLPRTYREWRRVPGIGEYTAAAIASIALNESVPVVDGNIKRVLARLLAVDVPIDPAQSERFRTLLLEAIPMRRPGTFNQALMELGQRICTPRHPACEPCPVRSFCRARKKGIQDRLPVRRPKPTIPHHEIGIGVVWKNGRILIGRRPENGLLGGLWEFPGGKRKNGETLERCILREIREETGIEAAVGPYLCRVKHRYSHFAVTLHVFRCTYRSGQARPLGCDTCSWVPLNDLDRYAFPAANKRIIEALRKEASAPTLWA